MLAALRADAEDWCRGRSWVVRAPLLVYFAWVLAEHLHDDDYASLIGSLNFGIHELGHFVFRPLGEFMGVAGGSLLQCLVPLASIEMFRRQRDYFAIAVSFAWLSTNLFYVATYAADAFEMRLPLLSPGGGHAVHDWNYLLDTLGLYAWDRRIALLLRIAGTVSMLVGLGLGAWLCWRMRAGERGRAPRP